jgi:hypothetical protein
MLWQALEKLAAVSAAGQDCLPEEAAKNAYSEIVKLNKLID